MSLRAKVRFIIAIAVGTILAIAISSYRSVISLNSGIDDVRLTQEVALHLVTIQALISDAETAQRGFVITGRESYLEPLVAARRAIPQTLADLDRKIVDAEQRARLRALRPLITSRLAQIMEVVTARRRNFPAARALVLTDRGSDTMEELRNALSTLNERQQSLLELRRAKRDTYAALTMILILAGGVVSTIFLLAAASVITREMTRRENSQRELERIRSEVTHHVSHELKTPISITSLALSMLTDSSREFSAEQKKLLSMAQRATEQSSRMSDDLLDASKSASGKLRVEVVPGDLSAALAAIGEELTPIVAKAGLVLTSAPPQRKISALFDGVRLRQILSNLIGNALKFTPKGGRINVGTKDGGNGHVEIYVQDTGLGIKKEELGRIFDRLYQTENKALQGTPGLGLGLHLCRELVAAHGGRIWVDSEPGKGTTFHFTLPLV